MIQLNLKFTTFVGLFNAKLIDEQTKYCNIINLYGWNHWDD